MGRRRKRRGDADDTDDEDESRSNSTLRTDVTQRKPGRGNRGNTDRESNQSSSDTTDSSNDYDSDIVPDTIHLRNNKSVQRSRAATYKNGPAGRTGVPESVRDVISSPGQSLDASVQRAMEDRMGDSFGDVQIHTGPRAANACESINARAFTVGNNIAFNSGEYDPSSAEGQHVIAHELAHVRQQTGGEISMLPQDELELEIDPDPELEREAEEMAQRVMAGGELGIQRLAETEVHVQRYVGSTGVDLEAQQEATETAKEMATAAGKVTTKRFVPSEIITALDVAMENTQDGPPSELVDTVADEVMERINEQTEYELETGSGNNKTDF